MGKTTFIKESIEILTERNYRIAVLKHDGHEFTMDHPGTDTDQFYKAGATEVIIFNDKKLSKIKRLETPFSYQEYILKNQDNWDLLIIEGLKNESYPKFEILRKGINETPVSNPINRLGIISDFDYSNEVNYSLNNPLKWIHDIEDLFLK